MWGRCVLIALVKSVHTVVTYMRAPVGTAYVQSVRAYISRYTRIPGRCGRYVRSAVGIYTYLQQVVVFFFNIRSCIISRYMQYVHQ